MGSSYLEQPFQVVLVVKNLPANAGDIRDVVQPLGWEDPLEEEMAIHSRILAWRIPWTEEPDRLQSIGLHSQTPLWKTLFCKQQINFYIYVHSS